MNDPQNCVFCCIAMHLLPTRVVFETERIMAFHDRAPVTPVHVLVIPKIHLVRLSDLDEQERELAADLMLGVNRAARETGLEEKGYCLISQSGDEVSWGVPHLHFHVLGGRALKWPPD